MPDKKPPIPSIRGAFHDKRNFRHCPLWLSLSLVKHDLLNRVSQNAKADRVAVIVNDIRSEHATRLVPQIRS